MNSWTLIRRSLRFRARSHMGVTLGAAIASATLIGALLVGDSVRASLRAMALSRLGRIQYALSTQDRLFQTSLRERLRAPAASDCPLAAMLVLPGVATKPDGSARVNNVAVVGVEPGGWPRFAGWPAAMPGAGAGGEAWAAGGVALLNETLARALGVRAGDEIIVRVRKPGAMGMDAAISPHNDSAAALRLRVGAIVPAGALGNFDLTSQPSAPANIFLPIEALARAAGVPGRANLLVADVSDAAALTRKLNEVWEPEDAGLTVRVIQQPAAATGGVALSPEIEIASSRIFLKPALVDAALTAGPGVTNKPADVAASIAHGQPVLAYLVNLIRAGSNATPYSIVAAANAPYVPADLRDDEIVINRWLADDLKSKAGDEVELSYFVVDSGSKLIERTNRFRVREIFPLEGRHADRTLMPEFPGLAKAERTRDWDAGFPLVHAIRDQDEAYWREYRGTPKAFVNLRSGQQMWTNRFGTATGIRFSVPPGMAAAAFREMVYENLRASQAPAKVGPRFLAVRAEAVQGAEQSQDFGQLFIGFSFFLIVAALLLMSMLFQFGLEQRRAEAGTLLAVGFAPRRVRRLYLLEGSALALAGGVAGVLGGMLYAWLMLLGLGTLWRSAVGVSALRFYATPGTVLAGFCASVAVAVFTIYLTLRKQARQPAVSLLAGELEAPPGGKRSWAGWTAWLSGLAALGLVGGALARGERQNAGVFFGAGALVLICGLAFMAARLRGIARTSRWKGLTLRGVAVRAMARRRKRSVTTAALLASACFVIAAIGVFRQDARRDAAQRAGGTGGFALFGESTLPVVKNLNTAAGREQYGLGGSDLAGVSVVPLRVRNGDEASCLNLNRPLKPRLVGVDPELFAGRFSFQAVAPGLDAKSGWGVLRAAVGADEIPAVADAEVLEWALHKRLGDTIEYTDDNGRPFKVRLVGALASSVLQGNLVVDEARFTRRFPGEAGYRMFFVDAPSNRVAEVSSALTRALEDTGLSLEPAAERLNAFNAVKNTYLGTFQILGGLGLLLGSAGLGVVVLRNALERRGELGLLTAVGFRRAQLQKLVFLEHGALLGLGLAIGLAAAAVAVLPALLAPGAELPSLSLGLTLLAVLLNGMAWAWLATRVALRGDLLEVLRNE